MKRSRAFLVNAVVKNVRRRLLTAARLARLSVTWRLATSRAWSRGRQAERLSGYRYLVVPSDPRALRGSRGDEAMLTALRDAVAESRPEAIGYALVASSEAAAAARGLGFHPILAWERPVWPTSRWLRLQAFDAAWVIGADIMDGHYEAYLPSRSIVIADLAAKAGTATTITGFSFNTNPDPRLRSYFARLDSRVTVLARDRHSRGRFEAFTGNPCALAADIAFLLRPKHDPSSLAAHDWAAAERAEGRSLLVVNIHPMLLTNASESNALVSATAEALLELIDQHEASIVLLGHDDRIAVGDQVALAPLHRVLSGRRERVLYVPALSAAAAKAFCASADALITGRMHLAIAGLGAGTATAGITYQQKFEGLLEEFKLHANFAVAPQDVIAEPSVLTALAVQLLDRQDEIRALIAERLPLVLQMAALNVAVLKGDPMEGAPGRSVN